MINYNFFYWGPYLWKTTLPQDLINQLLEKGKYASREFNSYLASDIDNVKAFNTEDTVWMNNILKDYFNCYIDTLKQFNPRIDPIQNIILVESWINFQRKHESNVEHIHDNDFSFVIYLKIPDILKEEHAKYKGRGAGPGSITFRYGEASDFILSGHNFMPEECDFYIFPASLAHSVASFKSDCERISISGNLKVIDDLIK
jgi:hypothetical protein